ncbi:MAG: elongation factor P [Bradymonadaceae bacterium]
MPVETQDFYSNLKIEFEGEPYEVIDCQHVQPGKGKGFVKTKLKNLLTGSIVQETFPSGETVETPQLETREMEYLYEDDGHYVFMDQDTYEQVRVDEDAVEAILDYLKENLAVDILFYEGTPIDVDPPTFVDLEIVEAPPGVKGDTAQGGTKTVTLETGVEVDVPLYLERGEVIRIDTRSGEYSERVS